MASEAWATYYPETTYPEWDTERAHPTPSGKRLMPADVPDPIAAKPVVLGLYHPSGALLYSGAATAEEAAGGLVALYRQVKPELPPVPAQTTTTTTTTTPGG
jgi:hypothetical protein